MGTWIDANWHIDVSQLEEVQVEELVTTITVWGERFYLDDIDHLEDGLYCYYYGSCRYSAADNIEEFLKKLVTEYPVTISFEYHYESEIYPCRVHLGESAEHMYVKDAVDDLEAALA